MLGIVVGLALLQTAVFGLLWWLIVSTEGVYLGQRAVIWLYDLFALRYERIKGFDPVLERRFLARPILQRLAPLSNPLVLDVATGTCRLPRALLAYPGFEGRIIGLDLSRQMLGQRQPARGRGAGVWPPAPVAPPGRAPALP
ncbi:MAG: class I SAM-dependent methyltransferase [Anaerolineae bacterium]|nr:class I SAM-dependent methyltransferase [Anaerolineae bacterium]